MKYHSDQIGTLTAPVKPGGGPWLVGSLTGVVASEKVTEAHKGSLRVDGNHPLSALA